MSTNYEGFFAAVTAAANEASNALVSNTPFLDSIRVDFEPEPMQPMGTIQIVIPNSSPSFSDVGSGAMTLNTLNSTTVNLPFNTHPAYGFQVPNWDQLRTPANIRAKFLDEGFKAGLEYLDNAIAALALPTKFTTNTRVVCATQNVITAAEITLAWQRLVDSKCPVRDMGNMFLMVGSPVYAGMLKDTTFWTPNSQVGYQIAGNIRRSALLGQQFGVWADFDTHLPTSASGSPQASSKSNLMFHRNAIALALRPLAPPTAPGVLSQTVYYRNPTWPSNMAIPFRVNLSYGQLALSDVISIDFGFGLAVVRPELGIVIEC